MTTDLQLGHASPLPGSPEEARLDRVPNPFAILVIDYVPDQWLVESKSLKLYMHSFRNHGAFHEDCTVAIGRRLTVLLEPRYLRIGGYWYPRGGIPIDVFWQTGKPPENIWLPDPGVAPYRPRG
jgi:7-cyano-7-deazaguanine reductase